MAIAGLHNISAFDSHSQVSSTQSLDGSRPRRTQASSVLQMWRDLEEENVARSTSERLTAGWRQERNDRLNDDISCTSLSESHGNENMGDFREMGEIDFEGEAWCGRQLGSPNENEDGDSSGFRVWVNGQGRGQVSSVPQENKSSRGQWLGENECERVKIIRGLVPMNNQSRGSVENQTAEIGAQIERVHDGLVVDPNEQRPNPIQRRIRRLCGRQALIDMLAKAEMVRQRELQALLEYRAVSQFPHRNRIQSLLKSRFLRNERVVEDLRLPSKAASELGLLTRRHTVSGLREGFISRVDNSINGQLSSNPFDTQSNSVRDAFINEEAQGNSSHGITDESIEQFNNMENVDNLEVNVAEYINGEERSDQEETLENEARDAYPIVCVELVHYVNGNPGGSTNAELDQETSGNEVQEYTQQQETGEAFHASPESRSEGSNLPDFLSEIWDEIQRNTVEDTNMQEYTAQVEHHEQATHDGDRDLQQFTTIGFSNQSNDVGEEMSRNWQGSSLNGSSHDMIDDESRHLQNLPGTNELWHEDRSEGSAEDWVDRSYNWEANPVSRDNSSYRLDDDNEHNMELRDLLSRRRVSNLLQSGFRESLDRLIQSYADRQSNVQIDWEAVHDQQSESQNDGQLHAIDSPVVQIPPITPPLWDQVLGQDNWSRQSMDQLDLDIINDMRIDMTRLHHRMNSLQKMLETCMGMQLELQRSIRQEVSAALNRSSDPPGFSSVPNKLILVCDHYNAAEIGDIFSNNKSKWDNVRKGICCICANNNIDSLLYRCGHMCTCPNCASKLVQDKGKCPMCQAPVIEVIRAYSISES